MEQQKQKHFLSLYQPVHDRFERFCRARACGQMEFRDLMHETLLIAYQKFDELRSEKAFLSFLFSICTRVISNYRKKSREKNFEDEIYIQQIPGNIKTDTDAEIHFLYQAISKLPNNQKESILLFEIAGFSIKEIAELHHTTISAVKKRLERGRKKLAVLLRESTIHQSTI